jgi:hypothetical protein
MTMRSLYEPLLIEAHPDSANRDDRLAISDLRCRSLVGLAVYLLTGERQVGSAPAFGETVPSALSAYLRECLNAQKQFGGAPQPADFIAAFEQHMPHDDSEGRGLAMIRNASKVAPEEMENAGAVSDFDQEVAPPSYLKNPVSKRLGVQSLPSHKPRENGLAGMLIWGVAGMVLALIAWLLFHDSGSNPQMATAQGPTSATSGQELPEVGARSTENPKSAATKTDTPASQPTPVMAPNRPRTPEEIRRAIKASSEEIEKARREAQKSQVAPTTTPSRGGLVESTRTNDSVR